MRKSLWTRFFMPHDFTEEDYQALLKHIDHLAESYGVGTELTVRLEPVETPIEKKAA